MLPAAARPPRRRVDGLVLIDKPVGPSSNAVLQHVKRLYTALKAGHGGTLDPLASGLLMVCLGEATKFSGWLLSSDKIYVGSIRLGVTTASGDAEGAILSSAPVPAALPDLAALAARFIGEIVQIPPRYSAIKVDGRPLYEHARAGLETEVPARMVVIRTLRLRRASADLIDFHLECGSGTYVRTLAQDIGDVIGCGAHLASLRRVASGRHHIADAITPDSLAELPAGDRDRRMLAPDTALSALPALTLDTVEATALMQGRMVQGEAGTVTGKTRAYGPDGRLLGVVDVGADGWITVLRLTSTADSGRNLAERA